MVTKLRLALLLLTVVPHSIVFAMYNTAVATDRLASQVEAVLLVIALLLALGVPGVVVRWLIGSPLAKIRRFCRHVKQGSYQERLVLPNESCDGDGEDEIVVLMRDMNWMARQIEIREKNLQQLIVDLQLSHQRTAEQNQHLVSMNQELLDTQRRLKAQTAALGKACCRMQIMAMTDPLTEIANRRCFFDTLKQKFAEVERNCLPLSLVSLDIDWFKRINDTYGHDAGDIVLKELAEIIRTSCRDGDVVARVGGEEYALLLLDAAADTAIDVARRIQLAIAGKQFFVADNLSVSITVFIGVCTLLNFTCFDKEKLYRYADQALYFSKQHGRNRISVFDPDTHSIQQVI